MIPITATEIQVVFDGQHTAITYLDSYEGKPKMFTDIRKGEYKVINFRIWSV